MPSRTLVPVRAPPTSAPHLPAARAGSPPAPTARLRQPSYPRPLRSPAPSPAPCLGRAIRSCACCRAGRLLALAPAAWLARSLPCVLAPALARAPSHRTHAAPPPSSCALVACSAGRGKRKGKNRMGIRMGQRTDAGGGEKERHQ
jgi:hypothetical protein